MPERCIQHERPAEWPRSARNFSYRYEVLLGSIRQLEGDWGEEGSRHLSTRIEIALLPSKIEDRFGNQISLTYTSDGRIDVMVASDGRRLDFDYTGYAGGYAGAYDTTHYVVTQITANSTDGSGSRVWSYNYSHTSGSLPQLIGIQLPDASSWTFGYVLEGDHKFTEVTMTAPSGLSGVYHFSKRWHPLGDVPTHGWGTSGPPLISACFEAYSLTDKTLSGPSVGKLAWIYTRSPAPDYDYNAYHPVCGWYHGDVPSNAESEKWIEVTSPAGGSHTLYAQHPVR